MNSNSLTTSNANVKKTNQSISGVDGGGGGEPFKMPTLTFLNSSAARTTYAEKAKSSFLPKWQWEDQKLKKEKISL